MPVDTYKRTHRELLEIRAMPKEINEVCTAFFRLTIIMWII
jgi:hypothetical protein